MLVVCHCFDDGEHWPRKRQLISVMDLEIRPVYLFLFFLRLFVVVILGSILNFTTALSS